MSRPQPPLGRPSFASRSVFDALPVDEGESEDEEVLQEPEPTLSPPVSAAESTNSPPSTPSTLSKSAQKRAKKLAAAVPLGSVLKQLGETITDSTTSPSVADVGGSDSSQTDSEVNVNVPAPLNLQPPSISNDPPRSPTRPTADATTPFSPSLPDALPQPASAGLGPRKRKASQDLKTNPLSKESKTDSLLNGSSNGYGNGITTATTEKGEKVGVVELAVEGVQSNPTHSADHEKGKRKQAAITRTIWGFLMIFVFLGLLAMGPPYLILLVFCCQALVYREVTALFGLTTKPKEILEEGKKTDPWSKTLNWYFFGITNYFLYGESIIYYFKHVVFADVRFLPFANNHRFISFMLYTIGFVGFVASLKKQFLRQQFGLFGWVHMSLLVIVISSHFIINNILEGMIWFWLPASLVICNDVFAYIWGMTFGKTQLIKLSPKKTVEGFVGAFFSTLIFGVAWATLFMKFNYMICPATDLGVHAWSNVECIPNPTFVWRIYQVPAPVQKMLLSLIGTTLPAIPWAPFQFHALVMATFASLVAPFGGFFASGFKRAFDIKDFGHSIPGHGGMTDRMDCQFLMGMFAYVYYSSLIRVNQVSVGSVLQTIVSGLSTKEQLELFEDLRRYLEGSGVL